MLITKIKTIPISILVCFIFSTSFNKFIYKYSPNFFKIFMENIYFN